MDSFFHRNLLLLFVFFHTAGLHGRNTDDGSTGPGAPVVESKYLAERFQLFSPLSSTSIFTITICADIPDNDNIERVHVGRQPGHVFLIIEKLDTLESHKPVVQVFGFYPVRQHSSLISGNVRSKIVDNSQREYDASLSKRLTPDEFEVVLKQAEHLAGRKYNLRRFNCYDYVMSVFNSIPGIEQLPVRHIKLPYLLGSAGSPCGLYGDLRRLQRDKSKWAPYIRFGTFTAPQSSKN